ncbi:MAG: hypothetical protein QXH42_01575 [Thermoplasmata archaeon]
MTPSGYLALLLWMFALVALSALNDRLLSRIFTSGRHRVFVWLGVVVHEASHWLACVLTGTKVFEVRMFERDGGYVRHERRGPVVMALIALAPIAGCSLFLVFLVHLFRALGVLFEPGGLELERPLESIFTLLKSAALTFWMNITALSIVTVLFLVFLYFVWSVAACLAPSRQDLGHAATGSVVLALLGALSVLLKPLSVLGVEGTPVMDFIGSALAEAVGVALIVSIFPLIIGIPIALAGSR